MKNGSKPAVGYIRMSTDQQQDSPARQRRDIEAMADRQGYRFIKWYEDHGQSGKLWFNQNLGIDKPIPIPDEAIGQRRVWREIGELARRSKQPYISKMFVSSSDRLAPPGRATMYVTLRLRGLLRKLVVKARAGDGCR